MLFLIIIDLRRLRNKICFKLTWSRETVNKRISRQTTSTAANRTVVHNLALCVTATGTRTRISTLLVNTREIRVTFRIHDTLWSTVRWGSYILRLTRAHCLTIYFLALAIWTTRGWLAYVSLVFVDCKVYNMELLSRSKNRRSNVKLKITGERSDGTFLLIFLF